MNPARIEGGIEEHLAFSREPSDQEITQTLGRGPISHVKGKLRRLWGYLINDTESPWLWWGPCKMFPIVVGTIALVSSPVWVPVFVVNSTKNFLQRTYFRTIGMIPEKRHGRILPYYRGTFETNLDFPPRYFFMMGQNIDTDVYPEETGKF